MITEKQLKDIANLLRRDSLISTTEAGSGHPTSCLSCAEIMTVLFFKEMKYDVKDSKNSNNDEFILSKGHAAPILYSALKRSGCIDYELKTLRKLNSPLEGHPMPRDISWVKVATGSLGQGLSVGIGMALAAKLQKNDYRTYVLMGDSECAEGSIYEALQLGIYYKLNNLCAIIDVNRLGQSGQTMLGHDINSYKKRFLGFGWNVITLDGHNIKQLITAFEKAKKEKNKPTVIIAKTLKGKGINSLENKEGKHGVALKKEELELALKEIKEVEMPKIEIHKPSVSKIQIKSSVNSIITNYKINELIATREAYGKALVKLASKNELIIATDGETKNSTHAEELLKYDKKKYLEAFIAEQNMVGMALGLSVKGYNVFASSFAAFLTRAHDQIRMSAVSNANLTIVGSHCGVSIGEDGVSQMGLEDIGMFRCLPNSIVLYPSDAVSTEKLVCLASNNYGIKYLRTTRGKTNVIYNNEEEFRLGEFKVVKSSNTDKAVILGSGITLHESLKAYEELKKQGINVTVVDCYCIKPFNHTKLIELVRKSGNKIIIVEDHYREGGIGEMILKGLVRTGIQTISLCVKELPHSGKPEELLERYGIDSKTIVRTFEEFV